MPFLSPNLLLINYLFTVICKYLLMCTVLVCLCMKSKYEALKEEYATYSRVLQETEDALQRVNVERTHCTNELNEVMRDMEMQYREKVRLEDEVLEKIRLQLTADKAAEYSAKIVRRLRERTKDLETQVC